MVQHSDIDHTGITGVGGSGAFVGVRSTRATTQSINDSTVTAISYTADTFDTDAFHDTGSNPDRFTVPSGKNGTYLIMARVQWDTNTTGARLAGLQVVSAGPTTTAIDEDDGAVSTGIDGKTNIVHGIYALAVGDYVRVVVYQNSGGARTTRAAAEGNWFAMYKIG